MSTKELYDKLGEMAKTAGEHIGALLWICRLLLVVLPLGLAITWGYVSAENLNGLFGEWPNMICKMA